MQEYSRGQKGKLSDLGITGKLAVDVTLLHAGMDLDVSCFGLDAAGKLSDDRYMIFFNQLAAPQNTIKLDLANGSERRQAYFAVQLDQLPSSIDKLVFAAAIDGNGTMQQIGNSHLQLSGNAGAVLNFGFKGSDFQQEKAVILAEVYRRDGQWRFAAVGQGFNGGLSALLASFGGVEAGAAPAPAPTPAPTPAPKKISLSKVTLEKRGDKVSLEKQSGKQFGRIHVNLNWARQEAPKPGFFGRFLGDAKDKETAIDLDLGCLFQMADGRPGAVQALGNAWGNFDAPPFIRLDADDRTGDISSGENMYINGQYFDHIKRVLIYAFIYEGAPNWGVTKGIVTINIPDQPPVEVRLDQGHSEMMCAIAMIENNGGQLQVTKIVEYFSGMGKISAHQQMDERFRFGLRWAEGSKD